eukprot:TRINITY_DN12921_c0_g1_i1.p1 TRINITY_DN12921_c0_g1~~TRINITY_DN12921_c0_g1_i1.p1  ORF type:complete len:234 (+),score=63.44 TRINITY_DN12921_c0_g1_i1:87-704(+)
MAQHPTAEWWMDECQRQLQARDAQWQQRWDKEQQESGQRMAELAAENERLRTKCSDLMMRNALAEADFAEAVKSFVKSTQLGGYVSGSNLMQWLQGKTNGLTGPDDGPLMGRGMPPGPPPPPAGASAINRKRMRDQEQPKAAAAGTKRSHDQCGEDGMATDDGPSGNVVTFWPGVAGMCAGEAAVAAAASSRGGWPVPKRMTCRS